MSANNIQRIFFRINSVYNRPIGIFRQEFLAFRKGMPTCVRCVHESRSNTNVTSSLPEANASLDNDSEQLSENDRVNPNFVNRNPRNLERMALARKDKGWSQSLTRKDYWHKLFITKSSRHITAYIEHIKGSRVVEASTQEWAIKQHLYSTSDVSASRNLGRVLAQRCLESGINFVHVNIEPDIRRNEKMAAFLDALREEGLVLGEPKSITDFRQPPNIFPNVD